MDLCQYVKSHKENMIQFLEEIVKRESPSTNKNAVDACSTFFNKELKKLGVKATRFPQKEIGNLYLAEYLSSRQKEKKGQILLLTHIDTVWPVGKLKKMPFRISANKVYGPGVLDMKASLVMAFFALKALKELQIHPKKRIALFINSAEEIGSEASYKVIKNLAKKSSCVLCLEPALPGGALKVQRKGRLVVRVETKGKAAHAGAPEEGVNAIEEMMFQLGHICKLKTKDITVNIGQVKGGEKPNIVAEEACAMLDIRYWKNAQKDKVLQSLKQLNPVLQGAQIKLIQQSTTPPMEKTKASATLLSSVRRIASSLNLTLEAGKTGGGSDASIASNLGIPTLDGLGPDGKGIHAENEHLLIPSLIERTVLLTEILSQL